MNNKPIHILNTTGVLASFSIAKKLTEEYVRNYFIRHKKIGKSETEINKLFIKKIENDITNAMRESKIPGLIKNEDILAKDLPDEILSNLPSINKLVVFIAHKIMLQKFNKMILCYIINSLVNLLNLTEDDFEKFHNLGDGDDDEIE